MSSRDRVTVTVGTALLVGMAMFSWRHMRVGDEITRFLPANADARLAHIPCTRAVTQSELARTMILAVSAPDIDHARARGPRTG